MPPSKSALNILGASSRAHAIKSQTPPCSQSAAPPSIFKFKPSNSSKYISDCPVLYPVGLSSSKHSHSVRESFIIFVKQVSIFDSIKKSHQHYEGGFFIQLIIEMVILRYYFRTSSALELNNASLTGTSFSTVKQVKTCVNKYICFFISTGT